MAKLTLNVSDSRTANLHPEGDLLHQPHELISLPKETVGRVRNVGLLDVETQHPSGSVKNLDLGGILNRPPDHGIGPVKNVRFHDLARILRIWVNCHRPPERVLIPSAV